MLATPEDRRPWLPVSAVARTLEPGLTPAGRHRRRAADPGHAAARPATEYLLLDADGSVFGVLVTDDVDRAFAAGAALAGPPLAAAERATSPHAEPARRRPAETPGPACTAGRCEPGEWVRLTDTKGRRHNICLERGQAVLHQPRLASTTTT